MEPVQATMLGIGLAAAAMGYLIIRLMMLARTADGTRREPSPPDPLAGDLAAALPALSDTRDDLQKMLWTAGFYRPSALTEYLAIRAVLFIGLLIGTALLCIFVEPARIPIVAVFGLLGAGLGFSLPRIVLAQLAAARARRLIRGLPTAMDVIGLCLTAGQNLLGSVAATSRELSGPFPDLSEELAIVHQQASMHSLEQALTHWAGRSGVSEIRSLALLLVQSERLGTDMVNTLLEVADSQRIHLRQKAEAQANRANFWMLLPTLFCLWIASAIILVGPVYIEFWKYRRDQMNTLIRDARTQIATQANPRTSQAEPAESPAPTTGAFPPRPTRAARPK
jgi:tight adherence protein C